MDFNYFFCMVKSKETNSDFKISEFACIGHVHLKVSNLDNSLKFYTQLLGFKLISKFGESAAFISSGKYHHHIGLNTWESLGANPPQRNSTGLYHFAILLPNRKEFAKILQRLISLNYPIDGLADHGVSEAIYISDPDKNGIEFYWDKPKNKWPMDENGNIKMYTLDLDISNVLNELK